MWMWVASSSFACVVIDDGHSVPCDLKILSSCFRKRPINRDHNFLYKLQFSDYLSLKVSNDTNSSEQAREFFSFGFLFWIGLIFSLVIPALHYCLTKQIPLLDQIFSSKTYQEISMERENYSKLSEIPQVFKIIPNYLFTFFAPFTISVLIWKRKIRLAIFLIAWMTFYALSSTADFPVLVLIGSIFIGALPILNRNQKKIVWVFCIILLLTSIISGISLTNKVNQSTLPCVVEGVYVDTPGNRIRSCRVDNVVWINPVVDRIGYRVFLTPIEVSNNWYSYFQAENISKRELISLLDRKLTNSAANEVGKWAFVKKFPDQYLESNASYGSIDADAFSFGWFYIILISILIFLIRLLPLFRVQKKMIRSNSLEGFVVAQLSIFPFLASFQAIFLTQGLVLVLVLIFLSVLKELSKMKNS